MAGLIKKNRVALAYFKIVTFLLPPMKAGGDFSPIFTILLYSLCSLFLFYILCENQKILTELLEVKLIKVWELPLTGSSWSF